MKSKYVLIPYAAYLRNSSLSEIQEPNDDSASHQNTESNLSAQDAKISEENLHSKTEPILSKNTEGFDEDKPSTTHTLAPEHQNFTEKNTSQETPNHIKPKNISKPTKSRKRASKSKLELPPEDNTDNTASHNAGSANKKLWLFK